MPPRVSWELVQGNVVFFLVVVVVIQDVNVGMAVVMAVILVVIVTVVAEDVDRAVALKLGAVRLFCQIDHWDMLIQFQFQTQVEIQVEIHQLLMLAVALLSLRPGLSLLSARGSRRGNHRA